MFFFQPSPTPFDLTWRMWGIHVRVNPWFWVLSAALGWGTLQLGGKNSSLGVLFLLLWILCVFVSILIHEMGHVLMGRIFGTDGHIILYSFGGLAIGSNDLSNRWKRIAVSFAGPLAGFILAGIVYLLPLKALLRNPTLSPQVLQFILVARVFLLEINVFWGLLNLLPIWPLDGGQISRNLSTWIMPRQGLSFSLGLSGLVAGLLAVNVLVANLRGSPLIPYLSIFSGDMYTAVFFGMLSLGSFMALQQAAPPRRGGECEEDKRAPWQQDPDYWKRGRDPRDD